MSEEFRDAAVKSEQARMREILTLPVPLGTTPLERAMAMFMEADTFLRENGLRVKMTHDQPAGPTRKQ